MGSKVKQEDGKNAIKVLEHMAPTLLGIIAAKYPAAASQVAIASLALAAIRMRSYLAPNRLKKLEEFLAENHEQITKRFADNETVRVLVWNLIEKYMSENSSKKRDMILNAIRQASNQDFINRDDWHSRLEIVLNQIDTNEANFIGDIYSQEIELRQRAISYRDYEPRALRKVEQSKRTALLDRLYSLQNYGLVVALDPQPGVYGQLTEMTQLEQMGVTPSDSQERKLPRVHLTDFGYFFVQKILAKDNFATASPLHF